MIKKFRFLLFILICALILSSLVSCNPPKEDDGTSPTVGSDTITTAGETTTEELMPDLPDNRFDGYEMKFYVRNEKHVIFAARDIFSEGETGEPINDAVYKRNRKIEEKYGIKISQTAVQDPGVNIQKMISAGDCPYDVMVEATVQSVTLSAKGMLTDIKTIPHLDFEKPWWDANLIKDASIGGKLYYAIGDMIISDKDGTWGLLFNKNMLGDRALEDPYKLVKNGTWTLDKFAEMCKTVSSDLNSDGKYSVKDDLFGFATEGYNNYIMTVGSGGRVADKDADDLPVLTLNTERSINAYEKALSIVNDIWTIKADDIRDVTGDVFYNGIIPAFNDGRIMFYMGSIALVPLFRGMEQEFGILPIPKLDEEQKTYHTTMSIYNNGGIYIPATNTELERTGILLEALAAESSKTLIPAFYDLTLKTKLSRDEESREMLDILFDGRILDIGATYNFGELLGTLTSYKPELVSMYEKREAAALKAIEKLKDSMK